MPRWPVAAGPEPEFPILFQRRKVSAGKGLPRVEVIHTP